MYWLEIITSAIAAFFIAIVPVSQEANILTFLMGLVIFCTLFPLWLITFVGHKQNSEISSDKQ